jgi:hypothetical protein
VSGDLPYTLRIFLAGTVWDTFVVVSDGHFQGDTDSSGGVEGDAIWSLSRHARGGVGLRYELAHAAALGGGPYESTSGFRAVLPLRVGARWGR